MVGERVLVAAAVATLLAGGGAAGLMLTSGGSVSSASGRAALPPVGGTAGAGAGSSPTAPPIPPVAVTVAGADPHGRVAWDAPLRVTAAHGSLSSVTVTDGDGTALAGSLGPTGWTSAATLTPTEHYDVQASFVDTTGKAGSTTLSASAADSTQHLTGVLTPGDADVVGVGQPVIIALNRPVALADRAAVTKRLAVRTVPAQTGGWRWVSATELHYRPKAYWKTGTRVSVVSDLAGLHVNGETWGKGRHTVAFSVGDSHVSTADAATHTLTVTDNGAVIKVLPMSAGRPEYPSKSGVHLALAKTPSIVMDSSTVGIPNDTSNGYRETVLWDVRLSYGGAFVHAAPWSVYAQGHSNVSHGCINLSTANAEWFFDFTQRGDIINVVNSGVPPLLSDPGTADWNIPWSQWVSLGS